MKSSLDTEKAEKLYMENCNDREIGEILGVSKAVISRWRKREKLPPNYSNYKCNRYKVFDSSGQRTLLVFEGTAKECAAYLGVSVSNVYVLYSKTRLNKHTRFYRICKVEENNET